MIKVCENPKCNKEHNGDYATGRFCSKQCSKSFSTLKNRKQINEKVSNKLKGKINEILLINNCLYCNKAIHYKRKFCCHSHWVIWYKENIVPQIDFSKRNIDSYKNGNRSIGGGKTKWYDYKNIRVQGTYELRACKIFDNWKESGKIKNWEYTKDRYEYIGIDGKKHVYLLDFKIIEHDDSFYYVETKGFIRDNDKEKWSAIKDLGYKLEIWFDEELKRNEI